MKSLREKKKAARRSHLTAVAARLFGRHGYEAVSMEEIAQAADVSTMTLYNYFPTKRSLLLAHFWDDRAHLEAKRLAILASPPANPLDALTGLFRIEFDTVKTRNERRLWREITVAVILEGFNVGRFDVGRQAFVDDVHRMLSALRKRGDLVDDVDLESLASAIAAIRWIVYRIYLLTDEMTMDDALAQVRKQFAVVLKGWVKPC